MAVANFVKVTMLHSLAVFISVSTSIADAVPSGGLMPPAHYYAAEVALSQGDTVTAGNELKLALQANPLNPRAHYMLGSLLAAQGKEDEAIIGFQRTIMIDPNHREAMHNLGTLLLRRGEPVAAAEILEAAVTTDQNYIPPYNSLAKAYYQAGLPELAIATYEEVLQRDSENNIALHNLALLVAETSPALDKTLPGNEQVNNDVEEPATPTASEVGSKSAGATAPGAAEKSSKAKAAYKPAKKKKQSPGTASTPSTSDFRKLLRDLPYVEVEEHAGILLLSGWTRGKKERDILDRVLEKWPDILDLTSTDSGDPQRMLEVDAVLFMVISFENESVGFNFLKLIDLSYTFFNNTASIAFGELKGLAAPGAVGNLLKLPTSGSLTVASVDYDVNIANAVDERIAVLTRPHLTTLNGTPASFHAGGEWVFRVSGIEKGDIKPYPFGINVKVTPTLLRTPGDDGEPRVHLAINAERTSVLEVLTAQASDEDVVFDKLSVDSQAILALDQTLILSGLSQRESRISDAGVPVIMDIPVVKYLFSQKTTVETNTAIIILLTPRDPAFVDEENRHSLSSFVDMRRAFVQARRGTNRDMLEFKKRYPEWQSLAPNRFSSHFFLLDNSDLYRSVSGEELIDENLDLNLLRSFNKNEKSDNSGSTNGNSDYFQIH